MKVFISWSGKRSKETAECLSAWIRQLIQAAETWISSDIDKGSRWNDQIKNELEESKIGIICLDKDNLQSEWILFEAGALSKTQDAYVCTFLLDIHPADIKPPLGQFQHTVFNKDDIKKLIHTINNRILATGEKTISEKDLDELFEVLFPLIAGKLTTIKNQKPLDEESKRTDREILEELLQTVRSSTHEQIKVLRIENQNLHLQLLTSQERYLREQARTSPPFPLDETNGIWIDLTPAERLDTQEGDIIDHPKFGKGKIVKRLGPAHNPYVTAIFENGRTTNLMLNVAPFKKFISQDIV